MALENLASPFGRRTLSLAMKASEAVAAACPEQAVAERWRLLKAVVKARQRLGLASSSLVVLEALLSCLPETVMSPGADLVVFPSNEQISLRAKGMAERSIRRHVALLVEAGLVIRRDSPNGKRFSVRSRAGDLLEAYGFDLSPLLARASQIEAFAEEIEAQERLKRALRRDVFTLRRYVSQALALAVEEALPGDWAAVTCSFEPLAVPLPREVDVKTLAEMKGVLRSVAAKVDILLETNAKNALESGNAGETDRRYLDSNTESPICFEPASEETDRQEAVQIDTTVIPMSRINLGLVLKACPDILDYAPDGISSWNDLRATAGMVRGFLGISPSAWDDAKAVLGEIDASISIAGLLQRSDEIRSAGGYLRELTARAAAGRFAVGPMIMALLKRRLAA